MSAHLSDPKFGTWNPLCIFVLFPGSVDSTHSYIVGTNTYHENAKLIHNTKQNINIPYGFCLSEWPTRPNIVKESAAEAELKYNMWNPHDIPTDNRLGLAT